MKLLLSIVAFALLACGAHAQQTMQGGIMESQGASRAAITSGAIGGVSSLGVNVAAPTGIFAIELFDSVTTGGLWLTRDAGGLKGQLKFGRNNAGARQSLVEVSGSSNAAASPNDGIGQAKAANGSAVMTEAFRWTATGVGVKTAANPTEALELAGNFTHTGFIQGTEIADPAAPAANQGRLYFRDNGAGKTQLVVRFPTGAIQVIATEP